MREAIKTLELTKLFIMYPGTASYVIDETIEALAIDDLESKLVSLA